MIQLRRAPTSPFFFLLVLVLTGPPTARAQDCVEVAPDVASLRLVAPERTFAGEQLLLQGKGFRLGTPTVSIGGMAANVVAARGDVGLIVVDVPAGLGPGIHVVSFTSNLQQSNELCVEVVSGTPPVTCALTGTARDELGTALPGTLLVALSPDGETFRQAGLADATGAWTMELAEGDATLLAIPPSFLAQDTELFLPDNIGFQTESIAGFACPAGDSVDVSFEFGRARVDIFLTDENFDPLPEASCDAESDEDFVFVLSDELGTCSFMLPPGTFEVFVDSPFFSRFIAPGVLAEIFVDEILGADIDTFFPVAAEGVLFCGTLVNPEERGVGDAEVSALEVSGGAPAGLALSASCTGEFAIAVPANTDLEFELFPPADQVGLPALVSAINIDRDTRAQFAFKLQAESELALLAPAPRATFVEGTPGAVGAPLVLTGQGFGGAGPELSFSPEAGGARLLGEDLVVDPERGLMIARVPTGAGTGVVIPAVGGVAGSPSPFSLSPDPFVMGSHVVTGTVSLEGGMPVPGAVVMFRNDVTELCPAGDRLIDYTVTDAAGQFSLRHSNAAGVLDVLPPVASGLAVHTEPMTSGRGDFDIELKLQAGITVSFVVEDADTGARIEGVQVDVEDALSFDRGLTDATGTAVVRLQAEGEVRVDFVPPFGSRYSAAEFVGVVSALGSETVTLQARHLVSGGLVDESGSPVVNALVEGLVDVEMAPDLFLFETQTGPDGGWCGPASGGVGMNDFFRLDVAFPDHDLASQSSSPTLRGERDLIHYPSLVAVVGADDTDGDGSPDCDDNCAAVSNPDQSDLDGDSVGDACDACPYDVTNIDFDGDGVCDDGDGSGVVGDSRCGDGVTDDTAPGCDDNCTWFENAGQEDGNADGRGDACAFVWCDVAPLDAPDDSVDVSDVIVMLRMSVLATPVTPERLKRSNVMPALIEGDNPQILTPLFTEPREVNVSDVIAAMRITVGLAEVVDAR